MKRGQKNGFQGLAWSAAAGIAMLLTALLFLWTPNLQPTRQRPLPTTPLCHAQIQSEFHKHNELELALVRSPALLALAQVEALPLAHCRPEQDITPPVDLSVTRPLPMPLAAPATELSIPAGATLRPVKKNDSRQFFAATASSVLSSANNSFSPPEGVKVEYLQGLAGKTLLLPEWSWQPWLSNGELSFECELRTDARGRVVQVLFDAPPPDAALSHALAQALYQKGQLQPPAACQGRVKVNFSRHDPSATAGR